MGKNESKKKEESYNVKTAVAQTESLPKDYKT